MCIRTLVLNSYYADFLVLKSPHVLQQRVVYSNLDVLLWRVGKLL